MRKPSWYRGIANKNDLIAWLVVAACAFLLLSVGLQEVNDWASNVFLSLGTTFLTFLLAVQVVDSVVQRHEKYLEKAERAALQRQEEEEWQTVRHHIGFYVNNVGNKCALAYRTAVGIGDDDLPRDKLSGSASEIENLRGMASFITETIIPALPNLQNLNRDGWKMMIATLQEADNDATLVLLLFGNRLRHEIYQQLLDVRREIKTVQHAYELNESILGGPGDPIFISEDMHIFDGLLIGAMHGKSPQEAVHVLRLLEIRDSVELGERLLRSAVRLLEATIPLLPQDAPDSALTR